ncbi:hypothetical protein D3C73_1447920 [compost metagenome]
MHAHTVRERAGPLMRPASKADTLAGAWPPAAQDSKASCARRSPASRKARTLPSATATRRSLPFARSSNTTSAWQRSSDFANSASTPLSGACTAATRIRTPPALDGNTTA